jgi:hypothetical protein
VWEFRNVRTFENETSKCSHLSCCRNFGIFTLVGSEFQLFLSFGVGISEFSHFWGRIFERRYVCTTTTLHLHYIYTIVMKRRDAQWCVTMNSDPRSIWTSFMGPNGGRSRVDLIDLESILNLSRIEQWSIWGRSRFNLASICSRSGMGRGRSGLDLIFVGVDREPDEHNCILFRIILFYSHPFKTIMSISKLFLTISIQFPIISKLFTLVSTLFHNMSALIQHHYALFQHISVYFQ